MDDQTTWFSRTIESWLAKVSSCIEDGTIFVAIARKAPRLFETVFKDHPEKEHLFKSVVTENALPFIGKYEDITRFCVVDDAIYYGTTFESVLSNISTRRYIYNQEPLDNKSLIAMPVVKSETIKPIKFVNLNDVPVVQESNVQYYIEHLVRNFRELHKPFDVEFPILYYNSSNNIDCPDLQERLKGIFGNSCDVYHVDYFRERLDSSNIKSTAKRQTCTIVFESELSEFSLREFAKIRLFVDEKGFRAVSYAPSILGEDIFTPNNNIFTGSEYSEIWEEALRLTEINSTNQEDSSCDISKYVVFNLQMPELNQLKLRHQIEDYRYARKKSLIILANYLLSFNFLMKYRKELSNLAKLCHCGNAQLDIYDLRLLYGDNFASMLMDKLIQFYNNGYYFEIGNVDSKYSALKSSFIKSVIPEKYDVAYMLANVSGWEKACNISEKLSIMFSNMHELIEKKSRGERPDTASRLRFGVSYDSMKAELTNSLYYPNSSDFDILNYHKWIDLKIDEGSVVPKYDRVKCMDNYYWRRLFRAGENEDRYTGHLIRIAIFIIQELLNCAATNSIFLPEYSIENRISLLFLEDNYGTNNTSLIKSRIGGIKWGILKSADDKYSITFYNDFVDVPTSLLEYLKRKEIVVPVDSGSILLNPAADMNEYRNGTTLELPLMKKIKDRIKGISLMDDEAVNSSIGELYRKFV